MPPSLAPHLQGENLILFNELCLALTGYELVLFLHVSVCGRDTPLAVLSCLLCGGLIEGGTC